MCQARGGRPDACYMGPLLLLGHMGGQQLPEPGVHTLEPQHRMRQGFLLMQETRWVRPVTDGVLSQTTLWSGYSLFGFARV